MLRDVKMRTTSGFNFFYKQNCNTSPVHPKEFETLLITTKKVINNFTNFLRTKPSSGQNTTIVQRIRNYMNSQRT